MSTEDRRAAYLADAADPAGADLSVAERGELDAVRDVLADEALWDGPPADLEDRVVAAVAAARLAATDEADGTDATDATDATDEDAPDVEPGRRDDLRARRRRRPTALAAAALVVGVAGGALGGAVLGRPGGEETVTVALAGAERAPGASGTADLTRTGSGWRVVLDVSGLPRRDDGRFYEAWLRDDDGVLVPLGTFNEADDDLVLWSGVSPRDFPTLTVTLEEADGDPGSSGERALVGQVEPEG